MGKHRQDCLHLCFGIPWSGSIRCFSWKENWYLLNIFRCHSCYSPSEEMGLCHEKAQILCWEMKRSDRRDSSHLSETETTSVSIQKEKEPTWFGSAENGRRSPMLCGQHWQWWGPLCRHDSRRTSHSKHGSQIYSSYFRQQLYWILWPSSILLLPYFRQGSWSSLPTHQADYLARSDSWTKPKPQPHHPSELQHSTECCSWQQC